MKTAQKKNTEKEKTMEAIIKESSHRFILVS